MTPLITKSARPCGVGSTSAKSYYEGRCTACLIAGFAYTLIDKAVMPYSLSDDKAVMPYSLSDREFLVFSPVGNLQELVNVRKNYNLKVDTPTKNNKAPLSTFDSMNTESRKMQYLKFIEQANRNFIEKSKGGLEELSQERKYLDLGVTSYITTANKSGNPVRGFRAFNSVDSSEHIRNIIRIRTLDDGTDFWPISDVIESFAEIDDVDSSEEEGVQAKDKLASGLLTGDTHKICDGIFNLIKIYSSSGSPTSGLIELKKSKKYFTEIMDTPNNNRNSDASFSEDERQSISTVGSAFGEQFSDEMSVLISLQNSNSPSQLLRAMEKAGMQSFKDSSTQNEDTVYTLASNEDVERVLGLITDSDRFETTKQMLVIHASLSAHYSNVVSDDN